MLSIPPDPSPTVVINGSEVSRLWHQGQPVVTFRQVDEFHQRPEGTARKAYHRHQNQFKVGVHAFVLQMDEAKHLGIAAPNGLVVLTQRGYLKLTKPFTDQLSWDIQDELIEHYFIPSEIRTGSLNLASVEQLDEEARVDWFTEVVTDPVRAVKVIHRLGCDLEQARTQIMELTPKAEFYDAVSGSIGSMTVKDAAQACGTGERRFFKWLRAHGYLQQGNRPYQRWIDRGYFETRLHTFNLDRGTITRTQPLVTGKGLARFQREMGCGHSLAFELDANLEVQS